MQVNEPGRGVDRSRRATLAALAGVLLAGASVALGGQVARADQGESRITFAGLTRFAADRARIFVQMDQKASPQVTESERGARITLPGATIAFDNNRNPLDARFLDTPLQEARWEEGAEGVTLVLRFRVPVALTYDFSPRRRGVSLNVDFSAK